MTYDSGLANSIRAMLDPKGVQRKTVEQLVRECIASRDEAWRQAQKLAEELATLRPARAHDGAYNDNLGEYWTRRT